MTDIHKAAQEAVDAADSSEQLRLIAAVLQAQQLTQQPPQQAPAVRPPANVGQWVAIGAAGSMAAIAFALSAVAVAISAVALTVCVLVLRGLWADYQRNRDQD